MSVAVFARGPPSGTPSARLEPVTDAAAALPCAHRLHAACLWGVQTSDCLGAASMMRCPLCRVPLDRHDLGTMGYRVGASALAATARRCHAFRCLLEGPPPSSAAHRPSSIVRAIRHCHDLTSLDGFVYNTCLLPLDRMIEHKLGFARALRRELSSVRRGVSSYEDVLSSLACHVEVLIHTAGHHTFGADGADGAVGAVGVDWP